MKKILSLALSLAVILSAFTFVMPQASTEEAPFIDYLMYKDFSDASSMSAVYSDYNNTTAIYNSETGAFAESLAARGYELTEEGTFKMKGTKSTYHTRFLEKKVTPLPQLVFSYDIKTNMSGNKGYYISVKGNTYGASAVALYDNGIIYANDKKSVQLGTFTAGQWTNITIVYDNVNPSGGYNKRDIYINGVYAGTHQVSSSAKLDYVQCGRLSYSPAIYLNTTQYVEFDNMKAYALPTNLDYEVENGAGKTITVNYNMIPSTGATEASNYTVTDKSGNAIAVSSAAVSERNPAQVVLTLASELAPYGEYTVKVNGENVKAATEAAAEGVTRVVAEAITISAEDAGCTFGAKVETFPFEDTENAYCVDFEKLTEATVKSIGGNYVTGSSNNHGAEAALTVDGDYKYLTVEQLSTTAQINARFPLDEYDFSGAPSAFIYEWKVRPHFSENPRAMFELRDGNWWGPAFPSLYDGKVYDRRIRDDSAKVIGKYTDGEWVTLTSVYFTEYVDVEGVQKIRRDTYINGKYAATNYEDIPSSNGSYYSFLKGTGTFCLSPAIRNYASQGTEAGATLDIDYHKVAKASAKLTAELADAKASPAGYVDLFLNNIPDEASLIENAYVVDEESALASKILYCEYPQGFNVSTYSQKARLWFENKLENEKNYKLRIIGAKDIYGNELKFEAEFFTAVPDAENLVITKADGKATATVTVNKPSEDFVLRIAAYKNIDGALIMTGSVEAALSAEGEVTTDSIDVSSADVVKAFAWKAGRPVMEHIAE